MKTNQILFILFILLIGKANAQSYYFNAAQVFGNIQQTSIEGAVVLNNGDIVYAITCKSNCNFVNAIIVRENPTTGNIVWAKEIQTGLSPVGEKLYVRNLQLSINDTIVYLTLNSYLTNSNLCYLIKIGTATGYVHYTKYYNYFNNCYAGRTLFEFPNGDIIFGLFNNGLRLVKYDVNGNPLWVKTLPLGTYSETMGNIFEPNNSLTFFSRNYNGSYYDLVAVNIDASANVNWAYQISGGMDFYPEGAIKVGNYYYVATENSGHNIILKLDANMNVVANKKWKSPLGTVGYVLKMFYYGNGKIAMSGVDDMLDNNVNTLGSVNIMLDTALNVVWMKNTHICSNSIGDDDKLIMFDKFSNGNLLLAGLTKNKASAYSIIDSTGNDLGCHLENTTNIVTTQIPSFTTTPLSLSSSTASLTFGTPLPTIVNFNFPQRNILCPTIFNTACFSYTSPSGNNIWTTSGIYTDFIPIMGKCDSVVIVNLTINTVDTTITNNAPQLISNQSGGTYQWVDCNNNYAAIPGATSQSFVANANGNYAVIVTANGCTDTSACANVSNVGFEELSNSNQFSIYPNPFTDKTIIKSTVELKNAVINVVNMFGQTVVQINNVNGQTITFNRGTLADGLYFIRLTQDNKVIATGKLVIADK